jgi:uncharacterized SAM-binding protein YcdF (DUF218 family)
MYYYLGVSVNKLENNPDYIVLLGGGGFPSESNLIRCYKTVELAKEYSSAVVIIALPGNISDTTSAIYLLRKELENQGILSERIICETKGTNTRMQAIEINKLVSNDSANILLVSSPEHMFRASRTFIKAGMVNTGAKPAFEKAIEASLLFDSDSLGGNKMFPDIGNNLSIRYQFWNHFKYQIIVFREYMAIMYYYFKNWI